MAVNYDKIGFTLIEKGLRDHINNDFNNVYISHHFKIKGNEFIRIHPFVKQYKFNDYKCF